MNKMELNRDGMWERLSEDTRRLLDLANQAGLVAQESRNNGLEISAHAEEKGFVTSGDMAVNELVHSEAKLRFPGADVLSEETHAGFDSEHSQEVLIVDPIDGTRWYKDNGEIWSINLALVENGVVRSAVISQPDLGILTFAEKGVGAFCQKDGKVALIRTNPESELSKTKVGLGVNYADHTAEVEISELAKQLFNQSRGLNSMESSGYELACVARGVSLGAYIHEGAKPWDKAAGMLIVNEAGGLATGWPGRDAIFEDGVLAAANSELYGKIKRLAHKYLPETIYQDPEFEVKKGDYFQNFMLRHLPEARLYKEYGLLNEEGSGGWRNVAKHQLLSAVATETIAELIGLPGEQSKWLTNISLTHDVDKRRQQESKTESEVIKEELLDKTQRPLVATTSNFTGFRNWTIDEYIMRYVDSSVGENDGSHWFGARDANNLPPVVFVPWRERVQMFKESKVEEGEEGRALYNGKTTWEMLEQIMITIEEKLFNKVIEVNPELATKYTDPSQLTELIESRIREKILAY